MEERRERWKRGGRERDKGKGGVVSEQWELVRCQACFWGCGSQQSHIPTVSDAEPGDAQGKEHQTLACSGMQRMT